MSSADAFDDLINPSQSHDQIQNQNQLQHQDHSISFYSSDRPFNGFADDQLEHDNPFADLNSSPILNPSTSPSPPIKQPDHSSLLEHQPTQSPVQPASSQNLVAIHPDPFKAHFPTASSILPAAVIEQDDVGFDGKAMQMPDDHLVSFASDQHGFVSDQPSFASDQHGFASDHNAFAADQEPFDDQHTQSPFQSSNGFNTDHFHSSAAIQQPFEDPSSPPPPSPHSPPTPNHLFRPSQLTQSAQSSAAPPHPETRPSKPNSPLFRPFGVTATLTSTTDDTFDESLLAQSATLPSTRPALPDILGGGSLGASVLLADSRSALPAFKKSPRKPARPASNSVGSSAITDDVRTSNGSRAQNIGEAIRPYRPLGLKMAQAKPIVVSAPPEQPAPKPPAAPIPSNKPSSQDVVGSPKQPSPTEPVTNVVADNETAERAPTVGHSVTSEGSEAEPTPRAVTGTSTAPSLSGSTSRAGSSTDRVVVSPISAISPPDNPRPSPSVEPESTEAPGSQTPSLSITVPPPPSSLPTLAAGKAAESIEKPQEEDAHDEVTARLEGFSRLSVKPAGPSESGSGQSGAAGDPRPRSESESEDDRPLASVREGLVQQQHSGQHSSLQPGPSSSTQPSFGSRAEPAFTPPMSLYTCSVGDPQKMGMINDIHTVYTVKTIANDPRSAGPLKGASTVLRRFRDFVWLFDALTSNNPGVIVPPIPDKNLRNRFQEGFIAARRVALEIFLQKTVNHPMLISDPDLKLFLESDSFSLEVKHRKHDSSHQPGWLANIAGPRFSEMDEFFDSRKVALESLEGQLKALHGSLAGAMKARRALSQSVGELAQALSALATCDLSKPLRNTLDRLAALHRQCHGWADAQSRAELEGLTATVEAYSRLTGSVRLTFSGRVKSWEKWQASLGHLRKVQANHEKAKRAAGNEHPSGLMYSLAELEEAERRAHDARNEFGDVSKLIKAEMQRFDQEKVEDFKAAICSYVDGLTERQRQVVRVWQEYYQLLQALSKHNAEASAAQKVGGAAGVAKTGAGAAQAVTNAQAEAEGNSGAANGERVAEAAVVAEDTSAWASASPVKEEHDEAQPNVQNGGDDGPRNGSGSGSGFRPAAEGGGRDGSVDEQHVEQSGLLVDHSSSGQNDEIPNWE